VATKFLKLEKFVNLNFTAFHKILKKHDKRLPNPCKAFYISRLHDQKWVRGDYSDVIVSMSNLYSTIRGDEEAVANENEKQVSGLDHLLSSLPFLSFGMEVNYDVIMIL
jgi:SPX domain protein involved in polyphosphate accumulation